MTTLDTLLRTHEGYRRYPYIDSVGKLSIGIGFNLTDVGLYPEEIEFILANRLRKLDRELASKMPWLWTLDPVRQAVLRDMAYNMGVAKLLGFTNTLTAVKAGRYADAADRMLVSKWSAQVGNRATRLSEMMRTGNWPVLQETTP